MKAYILRCKPRARFHFGGLALDNNSWLSTTSVWMPSDTLFSALVNIAAEFSTIQEIEALIDAFRNDQVRISSGFYLLEIGGKKIYFLPKPAHFALETPGDDYKKYAAVQLISKTVWENNWTPKDWQQHCVLLQKGKVLAAKSDIPEGLHQNNFESEKAGSIALYELGDYPRVKVHSPARTENYFHFTALHVADNALPLPGSSVHFYFLLDDKNLPTGSVHSTLETAIQMLPQVGVGGERAAGCGFFTGVEVDRDFVPPTGNSGCYASLSLTLPADLTELHATPYFQLVTRGGRQYGSETKKLKYVRMMSEGAVCNSLISGDFAKIGTNEGHTVYRYGKAFLLPTVKIPEPDHLIL